VSLTGPTELERISGAWTLPSRIFVLPAIEKAFWRYGGSPEGEVTPSAAPMRPSTPFADETAAACTLSATVVCVLCEYSDGGRGAPLARECLVSGWMSGPTFAMKAASPSRYNEASLVIDGCTPNSAHGCEASVELIGSRVALGIALLPLTKAYCAYASRTLQLPVGTRRLNVSAPPARNR
jgi:hypothetical protein